MHYGCPHTNNVFCKEILMIMYEVIHSKIIKILTGIVLGLSLASPARAWNECTVGLYHDLFNAIVPIQSLTPCEPATFSAEDAYDFQEVFDAGFDEPIAGYKLGLTGPLLFGATEPVYGRLYGSMLRGDNTKVFLDDFVKPMLELEVAYAFAADVPQGVTTEQLPSYVAQVAPAVELPDLFFKNLAELDWKDIIALNVGARQVIIGEPMDPSTVDVNDLYLSATYEGEIVAQGSTTNNIWGDQWQALLFLVQKLDERGYQIKAGDVVISGAVNPLIPIDRGFYEVDYGHLGTLQFRVK